MHTVLMEKNKHFLQLNERHFQLIKFSDVMITQLTTAQVIHRNVLTRDDNVWHVSSSLLIHMTVTSLPSKFC